MLGYIVLEMPYNDNHKSAKITMVKHFFLKQTTNKYRSTFDNFEYKRMH